MRHIVFVHGVGTASFNVAKEFEKNILPETEHMNVEIHTFWWKQLASKKEKRIENALGLTPKRVFSFSLTPRAAVETYLIAKIRNLIIGYFGDAVFYMSDNSKKVKAQLGKAILDIAKKDVKARISIVAHSMGSVIAFDLLTDPAFRKKLKQKNIPVENLFTVGSPLALFILRPNKGIRPDLALANRWVNIYDERDVIASPLRPFFRQCKDISVRLHGANALNSHLRYFSDPEVLNRILRSV